MAHSGSVKSLAVRPVAGCTDPLLFLFERTQQLIPLTAMGKPWRFRAWCHGVDLKVEFLLKKNKS